ncbi:MAG: hypothetical protein AAF806_28155 [Bacteroidota bacterium]
MSYEYLRKYLVFYSRLQNQLAIEYHYYECEKEGKKLKTRALIKAMRRRIIVEYDLPIKTSILRTTYSYKRQFLR